MSDDQIKHMVNRFLTWKLPENFNPDGGIKFDRFGNSGTPYQYQHNPVGTNLLDATQAEAMVRHMIEGLPDQKNTVTVELRDSEIAHLERFSSDMGMSPQACIKASLRLYVSQFSPPPKGSLAEPIEASASRPSHPEAEDGQ